MENNDNNKEQIYNTVFSIPDFFSIEDFGLYQMTLLGNDKNLKQIKNSEYIRAIFEFHPQDKEIIMKKSEAKKIYSFLKIIYNDKYMGILTHNNNKFEPKEILKKINLTRKIRGFIFTNLNIKEFPLTHFYLKETNDIDGDFDKTFLLIEKNKNLNGPTMSVNVNQNLVNNLEGTKVVLSTIIDNNNNYNNNYNQNNNNNNLNNANINSFQNQNKNTFTNQNINMNNQNQNAYNNFYNNNNNVNNNINNFQNNQNVQNPNFNNNFVNYKNNNMINQNNYQSNNNVQQNNIGKNQMVSQEQFNDFNNNNNMNLMMNQQLLNNNGYNFYQNQNYNNMQTFNSFSNSTNSINSNNSMNMMMISNNNNFNNMYNNNGIISNGMNMNQNLNNQAFNGIFVNNNNNNIKNQNIQNNDIQEFKLMIEGKNSSSFPFVGLKNVGLTCYMNSTLQCLLHIPELTDFFLNIYSKQRENFKKINHSTESKGKLSEKYSELVFNVMRNSTTKYEYSCGAIPPSDIHHAIGVLNPQFRAFDANDSKDLLLFLFQTMHEELNYLGDKKLKVVPKCDQTNAQNAFDFFMKVNSELNLSIFSYLFYGIFKSETKCDVCKVSYYNFQYFQILSFPLYNYGSANKSSFNIYQGFKDYVKKSKMGGDNQCFCQGCKKLTDSYVSSKIYYTPPYLIINLDYGKNKKYNPTKIEFGQSLDLTGFTDNLCNKRNYELIAISTHIGSSGISGHYIAYCKNLSKDDQNWYEFNDSSVSKVKFEDIKENSPYILIFKREDNNILNEFK